MIREVAEFTIDPARAEEFVAAVERAVDIFRAAKGCRGMSLEKVIEEEGTYRLIVMWESLEDHTVGFRGSEGFQQWRALAGPFFIGTPKVDHSAVAVIGFAA